MSDTITFIKNNSSLMIQINSFTHIPLYGRRKGRRLRGKKSELMETLLPQVKLEMPAAPLELGKIFPDKKSFAFEVGFGGGEHLAMLAAQNPEMGFIGCEPFVNGVASLLEHIDAQKLSNIRIYPDDARDILAALPDASLEKIFVLFPDPWPKKRHWPRRFIGPDNLPTLARVLKSGGELRAASDDPLLQEWMIDHLRAAGNFKPAPDTENGIYKTRPAHWPVTRYETKSLAKKKYAGWQGAQYYSFLRI